MAAHVPSLGDSHNFGRRVVARGDRIDKPRTLFWEWLVLGRGSPLRRALADAAERAGLGRDAFEFLPALDFAFDKADVGGSVERVALDDVRALSRTDQRALAGISGRALALLSWLGIADLHWENLVLGRDPEGRLVFGPLDVEMLFADMRLPTETKLLPDADPEYAAECQHACGLRRVLPYLGKPLSAELLLTMVAAYRQAFTALDRESNAIARVLAGLPELEHAPIRVCLRGTGDYVRARDEPLWPPLLPAEAEQLARGDIPYFFRLYGRPGIRYYAEPTLGEQRLLPLRGDVPRLEPLLRLSRGLRSPQRAKLRDEGSLALLGAFDHPGLSGRHELGGLAVRFLRQSLVLELPEGEELHSRRDLGAFVASVYLPCRCGEVRSVFVPAVTRCAPVTSAPAATTAPRAPRPSRSTLSRAHDRRDR